MAKIIFRPQSQPSAQPTPPPTWPPMNVPYSEEKGLMLVGDDQSQFTITLELNNGFEYPEFTRAGIAKYENGAQVGFIECQAVVWGETSLDLELPDYDTYSDAVQHCSEIGNMVFGLADGTYVNTGIDLS